MKRERGSYAAASYMPEVKDVLARVALTLKKRGDDAEAVLGVFKDAGYDVRRLTLYEWMSKVESDEPIISPEKGSGRPSNLTAQ